MDTEVRSVCVCVGVCVCGCACETKTRISGQRQKTEGRLKRPWGVPTETENFSKEQKTGIWGGGREVKN